MVNPQRLVFDYTRMMMGALYINPNPQHVLVRAWVAARCPVRSKLFPAMPIEVVEIDPAVVRVARKYFAFDPAGMIRVAEEVDGRVFVKRALR